MIARAGLDLNLLIAIFGDPDAWCGVSGSSAGATIECPTRLALPQSRTTSDQADRGTELHAFARICTVNPDGRAQALLDMPEKWRHTAAGMNIAAALEGLRVVGTETAYALDVQKRTVRFIGNNIERKYNETLVAGGQAPIGRYEIPFSMDVEAFYNDIPVELDYKSGQSIGDVEEHWQRRVCAAGLMFFYDTPTAISRVAYIRDDGTIIPDGTEFSVMDAEEFCDQLVKAIDAVWEARLLFANGIMPTVYPSDGACAYCPVMESCPYYTNFAKSMVGRLQAIEAGPELSTLTSDEKAKIFAELKIAEKIVEQQLGALRKLAAIEPIPALGDEDKEYRATQRSRSSFDGAAARGMIATLLRRDNKTDDEIADVLKKLDKSTSYTEVRKVKRILPVAS